METGKLSHEDYCRLIGELYVDSYRREAHLRGYISSITEQIDAMQAREDMLKAELDQTRKQIKD